MKQRQQGGGFFLGLIIGLLVGLGLALGVALYISKVPIPFVNKVPQRTAAQDAAEAEKNKNWDPNSGLYGKNPMRPTGPASAASAHSPSTLPAAAEPASAPRKDPRDPAEILADKPALGSIPSSVLPRSSADSVMTYFVQAGAYTTADDAEQQRGKLALMGLQAKLTEREQNGRIFYRVRLGPFDKREEATKAKERLDAAGIDAALVQVQK